jgi:hypothetical protein
MGLAGILDSFHPCLSSRAQTLMKIKLFNSLKEISEKEWKPLEPVDFPFASYQFLQALEETDCLGRRTGWRPLYLTSWQDGKLTGAIATFVKSNSYGEYIFDFTWAQAYETYGLDYYPKLTIAIPFTAATGPKILLSANLKTDETQATCRRLLQALKELGSELGTSSTHALFLPEAELDSFREAGFFIRHSFQYHWKNEPYTDFADFLSRLRSKRRKEILRERVQAQQSGLQFLKLSGSQLQTEHAVAMHRFYTSTVEKMGGHGYLTLEFFKHVFARMSEKILLVLAQKPSGEPVAGALNYFSENTLFGRHWGCLEEYRSLHFEICYYQGIEFAIEKKMKLFEAGAQGEHKFQRGFRPSLTYSAHKIQDPRMSSAIKHFVESEKRQIAELFQAYQRQTPFCRDEPGES